MDAALASEIVNVLIVVLLSYGAVYFGQYKGLVQKLGHLETDLKNYLADSVVTPDEVADLQTDLEDLRAEVTKLSA